MRAGTCKRVRISTGIRALDKLLEGGFLKGSAVLLVGPPRMGKSLFATHFVCGGNGDVGVYVTTTDLGEHVKKRVEAFCKGLKDFKIVDAYSSTARKGVKSVVNVGKSNLSDISVALSEIVKSYNKKVIRCCVDSVSNLLLHNSLDDVANFLEDSISKFRSRGDILFLVVEQGMHDSEVYVMLESLTDSTITLEEKSDGSFLRLKGFNVDAEKILEFIPYKITGRGVVFK